MGVSVSSIAPLVVTQFRKRNMSTVLAWDSKKTPSPTWAAMSERTDGGIQSVGHQVNLLTGYGNAIGPTFADVQTFSASDVDGTRNKYEKFTVLPPTSDDAYNGICTLKRKAIDDAEQKGSVDATVGFVNREMKGTMESMIQRFHMLSAGAGWGRAATIKAAPTASPNTVKIDLALAKYIPLYTRLVAGQYESTGALRSATQLYVVGMTPDYANQLATLTLSGSPVALSWADGDTLFYAGHRQDAANPVKIVPAGINAWNPFTTETTGTFYGLSRVGRPDLQGLQYDCSVFPTAFEAVQNMTAFHESLGLTMSAWHVADNIYQALVRSQFSKELLKMQVEYGPMKIGYKTIGILHKGKEIPIISDGTLEAGQMRGGPWDDKELGPYLVHSDKLQLINIDDRGGNLLRTKESSTDYEIRLYSDFQFVVPGIAHYIACSKVAAV